VALGLLLALGACASNDPWRDAGLAWNGQEVKPRPSECDRPYADTDALIWREMQNPNTSESSRSQLTKNVNKIIRPQLGDRQNPIYPCWRVSYENHQGLPLPSQSLGAGPLPQPYDLLIAEFDDQGERTDVSRGKAEFANSEVALIEAQLDGLIKKETARGGGVNIIVFTHGWHGSAVATDDYSIWLKSILQQIAYLERASRRSTCRSGGQHLKNTDNPAEQAAIQARMKEYGCPPAAQPQMAQPQMWSNSPMTWSAPQQWCSSGRALPQPPTGIVSCRNPPQKPVRRRISSGGVVADLGSWRGATSFGIYLHRRMDLLALQIATGTH